MGELLNNSSAILEPITTTLRPVSSSLLEKKRPSSGNMLYTKDKFWLLPMSEVATWSLRLLAVTLLITAGTTTASGNPSCNWR